jgi:DNA ligase (NAD+)
VNANKKKYSAANVRSMGAKYAKLLDEINLHDQLYYRENNPKITDFEYDCLKAEAEHLQEILAQHAGRILETAIGDDRIGGFETFDHLSPMMSLANTYSRDELLQFDSRLRAAVGDRKFSYAVEPKIDGIAINLIYRNGKFFRALTRGNGTSGDDVSRNIKLIENLPLRVDAEADEMEVRGEVYIDGSTFEAVNRLRQERGLPTFSNPRNLAAGTLKTLNPQEIADRQLRMIAYAIGHCSAKIANSQSEVLTYLGRAGFQSQEKYWIAANVNEAWLCIGELEQLRRKFSYWTDGAVLKVNELELHNQLGATAKSPRWAIAYKFEPERATTKLRSIILQVGRTGVITPVADLESVQLSGTVVSRATLHNADEIAKKDIRIGDFVVVEKAGEIIPAIISIDLSRRDPQSKPFIFPQNCPACGSKLIRIDGEVAWRCQNACCLPQVQRRLEHFLSKEAMDIDGLGTAIVEKLVAGEKLRNLSDVYRLTFDDLANLEKCGPKIALKILGNIGQSKTRPLWRLLHGLGICGVGAQTAKLLSKKFHQIGDLMTAKAEDFEVVDGVGCKTAAAIAAFFSEPDNWNLIGELRNLGLCCSEGHGSKNVSDLNSVARDETNFLKNETSSMANHGAENAVPSEFSEKNFVLTGTLSSLSRSEAMEAIEARGGRVTGSPSKHTHALIAGNGGGSKLAKAQSLAIDIWNEEQFLEKLNY